MLFLSMGREAIVQSMDGFRNLWPGRKSKNSALRTKRTKSGKRAEPTIGGSVVRKICALCALCELRGCLSKLVFLIEGLPCCAAAV